MTQSAALEIVPEINPGSMQIVPPATLTGGLDIAAIQGRVADIENVISSLMVRGVHYGQAFPGSEKDSLLQPGAEMIFMSFGLVVDPEPREEKLDGGHLRVICEGQVTSADGRPLGHITAECSTMEPKYRFRFAGLECPECRATEIRKSKRRETDPAGKKMGYYCWKKAGVAAGCSAQFEHDDVRITEQVVGKVEHDNPEEQWHTVRMMSQKRWLVALARRTFALSARFVDQQAAEDSPFDVKQLGPILRALPGERVAKWSEVVAFTLQRFGKAPKKLTCLEGAVVLQWLGGQIEGSSAKLSASDFGYSPEPNGDDGDDKGRPSAKADPRISEAQRDEALEAIRGRKGVTFPKLIKKIGWKYSTVGDVPADLFAELMAAIQADDKPKGATADDGQLKDVESAMRAAGTDWDAVREKNADLPELPIDLPAGQVGATLELIWEMKDGAAAAGSQ